MRRFLVQVVIEALIAFAVIFVLSLIHITQPFPFGQGEATIGGEAVRPGEVWLVPGASQAAGCTAVKFLRTFAP